MQEIMENLGNKIADKYIVNGYRHPFVASENSLVFNFSTQHGAINFSRKVQVDFAQYWPYFYCRVTEGDKYWYCTLSLNVGVKLTDFPELIFPEIKPNISKTDYNGWGHSLRMAWDNNAHPDLPAYED